ncbi:MAG TPA: hypothetical protein VFL13_12545 [Candidatus Baltobacteraceae bacterium]|nr:hypothetical protein [Candidatus Baltobacteraceae bacterium]
MKVIRNLACMLGLVSLCACGGGGGGIFGNNPIFNGGGGSECITGTTEELARPAPNSYSPNTNTLEIVASGNNNNLASSYQNWYLFAVSNTSGQQIQGGQLNPVSDTSGPHPYAQDFFYASQLNGALPSGQSWTVYLTQFNNSCGPVPLQTFST